MFVVVGVVVYVCNKHRIITNYLVQYNNYDDSIKSIDQLWCKLVLYRSCTLR